MNDCFCVNNYRCKYKYNIKRTSKIYMMFVNEFRVLLLGVKNEKLGMRLEKNICP